MSVEIESLFTTALGLQAPWSVKKVALDTVGQRIYFTRTGHVKQFPSPLCNEPEQGIYDRLKREWRHIDVFQFEAWLHAAVLRSACSVCAKTSQIAVFIHRGV